MTRRLDNRYIFYLPNTTAESTVAYFWSGINMCNIDRSFPYLQHKLYKEIYEKYGRNLWLN